MKLHINIDDDLAAVYYDHAVNIGRTLEQVMADRLLQCAEHPPEARVIFLYGEALNAVEAMTQPGAIVSGRDLAERVRTLCDVKVGEVRIEFTMPQIQSLSRWAFKNGITTEEAIRRTVENMSRLFFDYVPVAKT